MRYSLLLRPHANVRYQESVQSLSVAELSLFLPAFGVQSVPEPSLSAGLPMLSFEAEELNAAQIKGLLCHSAAFALFREEGELLRPLGVPQLRMDGDISGILKYKGKTNEQFCAMLLNIAVLSGAFAGRYSSCLQVLDPLCGRGTLLFEGLRRGWEASGVEIDATDVQELTRFFEKYLQHGKYKHKVDTISMTGKGRQVGKKTRFVFARDARELKEEPSALDVTLGDTRDILSFYKPEFFHAVAADLPYGIQHASMDGKNKVDTTQVMRAALPQYLRVMRRGAAISLAFNSYAISREQVRQMLSDAGFTVCSGGVYDTFEHWVEQAVMRDIAVGIRP